MRQLALTLLLVAGAALADESSSGSAAQDSSRDLKVSVSAVNGSAASTAATGVLKVGVVGSTGTSLDGTTAGVVDTNLKNVGGSAVSTAATGVPKVGVVGNAGAAIDAANNASPPANVVADGIETATQGSTQPTASSAGNMRRLVGSTDGALYTRNGGPVTWNCSLDAVAASLTQCQAAPASGFKLYVTDLTITSTTSTGGQFLLRQGTGTNCATGTGSVFPSAATVVRVPYAANTAAATVLQWLTPIQLTAANALCVLCVATNTCTVQIHGYTAP